MRIVCIIPARGGSKRLPRKNVQTLNGKPLIQWSIEACLGCTYLQKDDIFVSSEDDEILDFASTLGVEIIKRPHELAEDHVWTQDVLEHAVKTIEGSRELTDVVVRVQANSPQVESLTIGTCIDKLLKYDLWEVFTVNEHGIEDAAVHVMRRRCVEQRALSVYKGVVTTDYIDIHTREDLERVSKIMRGDE